MYVTLKNESKFDIQYPLGNLLELTEEALRAMSLSGGVMIEGYYTTLVADTIGVTRKLVTAC